MDFSVELDDEFLFSTEEVDDELADPMLSAKLQSEKSSTSEQLPEDLLCRRLIAAQSSRKLDQTNKLGIVAHLHASYPEFAAGDGALSR